MSKESSRLQPLREEEGQTSYTNPSPASPEPPTGLSDSVDQAVSFTVSLLRGCFTLWLIGLFSLFVKAAKFIPGCTWYLAALPIWFGNLLLATLQANLVLRVVLCFGQGRVLTESDYRILAMTPGSKATLEHSISEDSTLLVTRATAGVILSVPVLLLVTATEILLCGYLETGTPDIWTCFTPLMIVQIVSVTQALLIRNTVQSVLCHVLLLLVTISVARAADETQPSWIIALLPLWGLNVLFLYHFVTIFSNYWGGRFHLGAQQLLCCALYLCSLLLTSFGEAMVAFGSSSLPNHPDPFIDVYFPLCTIFFGVFIFYVAAIIVVQEHAHWLVVTRGFGDPMPLSITEEGEWEPSGEEPVYDFFLGALEKRSRQTLFQLAPIPALDAVPETVDGAQAVHSDNYDSGCDSAAFNDIYGGNTTGASGAEESS